MIKKNIYIWMLLFGCVLVNKAQINDQPDMPVIYKVTVDPVTGYDSIIWYPQTDTLTDYFAVCHPKITNPNYPYILGEPIAHIHPDTFYYVNKNTQSGLQSVGYSVIAVHIRGPNNEVQSVYDHPDSTVYLTAVFDSCKAEVRLNWNTYNKWAGNIESYRIYQITGGHEPEIVAIIALEERTSHTLNISGNMQTDYFIEIQHRDGIRSSRSNRVTVHPDMLNIPDYIVAGSANPSGNSTLQLNFYVDHASELSEYQLWRSSAIDGTYELINTITDPGHNITLTDDINYSESVYYYKLAALNKCSESIRNSNVINNLVLNVTNTSLANQLAWNTVENWAGETRNYVVYRRVTETGTTDSIVLNSELSFTDDVSSYFETSRASSGEFCYQVKATEINNPYNINSVEYSNEYCIRVTPDLQVPNAFIPNNPAGENDRLSPVFLYEPLSYELVIYNRWGNKVWEGEGSWDGKSNNKFVPEGVYVYQLSVLYPDNTIVKSGYVTVIYR